MSRHIRLLVFFCIIILLGGCSTDKIMKKEASEIEKETSQVTPLAPRELPEVKPPAVEEKPDPLAGKTITLTASNAGFTDIFSAISDIAGLDLVIDSRLVSEGSSFSAYVQPAAASGTPAQGMQSSTLPDSLKAGQCRIQQDPPR